MAVMESYCGDDESSGFYGIATHPPCEYRNGMPCEPCNELTEIEAQIEDLQKDLHDKHRQVRVKRNHVHSPLVHRFPLEIVSHIFTLAFPPRETNSCYHPRERVLSLILTRVCHTWRDLALSIPRLWCDISVNAEYPNFPLLDHQIAHSGMVPLSIHLFTSTSGPLLQYAPAARQALSFVRKQLHRTASFCLVLEDNFIELFNSNLQAAPALKELHVHCRRLSITTTTSWLLRVAIEPPRPRRVLLDGVSYKQVSIDWTNVSSLVLRRCCIDGSFPETSLPALRVLEIAAWETLTTLEPMICDLLHRSLCPLQVLNICEWVWDTEEGTTRVLLDVLEIANRLQQLTLQLMVYKKDSSIEPLLRRLSRRDRSFLPCLQSLCLRISCIPPLGLLLEAMSTNDLTTTPLQELILELDETDCNPIPVSDLLQILRLRAAGKTISITYSSSWDHFSGAVDAVEYSKRIHGVGDMSSFSVVTLKTQEF